MLWKDSLALWIRSQPMSNTDYDLWVKNRAKFPRVRFKTFDSRGRVVAIQLEGTGEWMKPKEWADLHIQNLLQRVHDDGERLSAILSPTAAAELISGALPTMRLSTSQQYSNLLVERDDLANKLALAMREIRHIRGVEQDRNALEGKVDRMLTIIKDNLTITTPKAIRKLVE